MGGCAGEAGDGGQVAQSDRLPAFPEDSELAAIAQGSEEHRATANVDEARRRRRLKDEGSGWRGGGSVERARELHAALHVEEQQPMRAACHPRRVVCRQHEARRRSERPTPRHGAPGRERGTVLVATADSAHAAADMRFARLDVAVARQARAHTP